MQYSEDKMNRDLIEHLKKLNAIYNKDNASSKDREFYSKQVMVMLPDIIRALRTGS